jgi:hypothetical protein
MARKWSNLNLPGALHYLTGNLINRVPVFKQDACSYQQKCIVKISDDPRFIRETPDLDGSIHQVWQESFKAMPLWSGWMIWQKINYIHANPVKARLVSSARNYLWSSYRAFYENRGEPLAVDHDWWWPDDSEKLSKAVKELGWRTHL